MRKGEFLKALEKKLTILNENERNDIINEYRDTIEEKVKHGVSEEKAVEDFGDLDVLARDILSAYKINPDFKQESDFSQKTQQAIKSGETWIRGAAEKMADFSRKTVEDVKKSDSVSLEMIFEIIIKIFIVLFGLGILRLLFMLFGKVIFKIFHFSFFPIGGAFEIIFVIFFNVIYFALSILIITLIFTKYFSKNKTKQTTASSKQANNTKETVQTESVVEEKKSKKKEPTLEPLKSSNPFYFILRFFLTICLFIPVILINIALAIAFVLVIYFLIKGLPLWGVLILIVGFCIFWNYIGNLISNVIFSKVRKVSVAPFIFSAIFIMVGGIVTFETVVRMEYHDTVPEYMKPIVETYTGNVDQSLFIHVEDGTKRIVIDESLSDHQVVIEYAYYQDVVKYYLDREGMNIDIEKDDIRKSERIRKLASILFQNLKQHEIYQYDLLYQTNVTVRVNGKTRSLVN